MDAIKELEKLLEDANANEQVILNITATCWDFGTNKLFDDKITIERPRADFDTKNWFFADDLEEVVVEMLHEYLGSQCCKEHKITGIKVGNKELAFT